MGLSLEDILSKTGDEELVERARISLGKLDAASKRAGIDLTRGIIECGAVIDHSQSLKHAYEEGQIEELFRRLLGWAATVDKEIELAFFDDVAHAPAVLELTNYQGWLQANKPKRFGNTNIYDAIVRIARMAAATLEAPQILDLIARKKKLSGGWGEYTVPLDQLRPVRTHKMYHATLITDGASNRGPYPYSAEIQELIVRLSYCAIQINVIFVGGDRAGREFLSFLDTMPVARHADDVRPGDANPSPGVRYIDNVQKVEWLQGLSAVGTPAFAEAMTTELPYYLPGAIKRGLLSRANAVYI